MKATHRVKFSSGKISGFIIDGKYRSYRTVRKNVNVIENLTVTKTGVIKEKSQLLLEMTKQDINKQEYQEKVKQNPLQRNIQEEFSYWKESRSDYVLYLSGARQI